MPRRFAACLCLLLLGLAGSGAQEGTAAPGQAAPAPASPAPAAAQASPDPQREALVVELSTADFYELAARSRELGLKDTGGAEELRSRLYEHYGLEAPKPAARGRTVTIERAAQASYAKVQDEEGGIVRASGGVILSLVETNGDTHRIKADSLAYDRVHGTLTARGSVSYERKSGSTTEVFAGEALSATMEDWSGVFIDGKVRRTGVAAGAGAGDRGLVVAADTIVRRSADVMVLKDGVISSCDADDPHYAVRAGRVWLLGDREWAVADAVFSLGNVPILWLPFFYYPGEELAFHPVLGYRSREGRFVQTTYYLVGAKPPKKDTTSILSFKDTGVAKPTQLKGLFLRTVPGPAPKDEGSLKAMADLYSGLGGFGGIQGSFPKLGALGKTDFFAGVGLSRSLFPPGTDPGQDQYSPFVSAGGYASQWNRSLLLGRSLPFRYALDLTTSIRAGNLSASLALPLYSDTYFDRDFRNRSEDMDWLGLLSSKEDSTTAPAERIQLLPRLDASLSFKPAGLDPWVSSMDITRFSSSMTILSKAADLSAVEGAVLAARDPQQKFFYPSILRPADIAVSLRGSLLGTPAQAQTAAGKSGTPGGGAVELRSPWEGGDEATAAEGPQDLPADQSSTAAGPGADFRLPPRVADAPVGMPPAWSATAGWSLTPSAYLEDSYKSSAWTVPSDIDYGLSYRLLSYRLLASLDSTLSYGQILSSSLGLSYSDQDQTRPVGAASFVDADRSYKTRRLGESAKLTLKPFSSSWLWSLSSLSYGLDSSIYGLKYDTGAAAFKESWLSWDPATITAHNLTLYLAARPGSLTQSLTVTANLPPLLDSYTGILAFSASQASLRLQSRMFRKAAGSDFSFDPITASLNLGTAPGPSLADNLVYDASGLGAVSNSTSLVWGPFSAALSEKRSRSYKPVLGSGWVASGAEAFVPTDLSLALKPEWKGGQAVGQGGASAPQAQGAAAGPAAPVWALSANLSLAQSLVRFSESTLGFTLGASINLGESFSLSFSSTSQNSAAWRYYADLFAAPLASGGFAAGTFRVNPLTDIADSLAIWDPASLRKSLFKLKALSFKAAQDLHDWTLSAEVSTKPLYDPNLKFYSLDTSFTVLLAWKDIQTIKSSVKKDSTGLSY